MIQNHSSDPRGTHTRAAASVHQDHYCVTSYSFLFEMFNRLPAGMEPSNLYNVSYPGNKAFILYPTSLFEALQISPGPNGNRTPCLGITFRSPKPQHF